jgi:hypothetical protein
VGKKAIIYEISSSQKKIAFFIRFDNCENKSVAAYYERAERAEGLKEPAERCRGYST